MENFSKSPVSMYFFLLLAIFVLIFFTKDIYFDTKLKSENIKLIQNEIDLKKKEYEEILSLKNKIDSKEVTDINFDSFLKPFNEQDFLVYFNNYVLKNADKMSIKTISLKDWVRNDFWFREWNLNLTMTFVDEESMMKFLNFIIYNKDYNFYMDDFTYPFWTKETNFSLTFNIKVLYK